MVRTGNTRSSSGVRPGLSTKHQTVQYSIFLQTTSCLLAYDIKWTKDEGMRWGNKSAKKRLSCWSTKEERYLTLSFQQQVLARRRLTADLFYFRQQVQLEEETYNSIVSCWEEVEGELQRSLDTHRPSKLHNRCTRRGKLKILQVRIQLTVACEIERLCDLLKKNNWMKPLKTLSYL